MNDSRSHTVELLVLGLVEFVAAVCLIALPFAQHIDSGVWTTVLIAGGMVLLAHLMLWLVARNPSRGSGVSALARGTSVDLEAGRRTVLDRRRRSR